MLLVSSLLVFINFNMSVCKSILDFCDNFIKLHTILTCPSSSNVVFLLGIMFFLSIFLANATFVTSFFLFAMLSSFSVIGISTISIFFLFIVNMSSSSLSSIKKIIYDVKWLNAFCVQQK